MIQLLFSILFGEAALVLFLMIKTPIRKLAIMGLDRLKRGRGPIVVKTISATVSVVLLSSIYSMVKIQNRSVEFGALTPTDQVLMSRHLLEASLMGFSMFLALIIDRLHHYLRELRVKRKSMESAKTQNRGFEDGKGGGSELKALLEDIAGLKAKVKRLESEAEAKEKEVKTAQTNASALKKQLDGFLVEYDRLSEDNQNLRDQLKLIDRKLSHSDSKKKM